MEEYFKYVIDYAPKLIPAFAAMWAILKYGKKAYVSIVEYLSAPTKISYIESQLKTNGGSSIKDAIARIEQRQIAAEQRSLYIIDADGISGAFETGADGKWIRGSMGLSRLLSRSFEEIADNNWIQIVAEEEREEVLKSWESAIEHKTIFNKKFTIIIREKPHKVNCAAFPMVLKKDLIGYFGIIKLIQDHP